MKKLITILLMAAMVLSITACNDNGTTEEPQERRTQTTTDPMNGNDTPTITTEPETNTTEPTPEQVNVNPFTDLSIDDVIKFGNHNWIVLDVEDEKALLLREEVLQDNPFWGQSGPDRSDVVHWENSRYRAWLNDNFLTTFGNDEQSFIIEVELENPACPWNPTRKPAGDNTLDRIFLLSVDEVVQYFGDSGALEQVRQGTMVVGELPDGHRYTVSHSPIWESDGIIDYRISDEFNEKRMATRTGAAAGSTGYWMLRSSLTNIPEEESYQYREWHGYTTVSKDGIITPYYVNPYMRPAMWVDMSPRMEMGNAPVANNNTDELRTGQELFDIYDAIPATQELAYSIMNPEQKDFTDSLCDEEFARLAEVWVDTHIDTMRSRIAGTTHETGYEVFYMMGNRRQP